MARPDRTTVVLVAVGVLALVVGGLFAYVTVRDTGTKKPTAAAHQVRTRGFVSAKGGFRVRVPRGMDVVRRGRTARFTTKDKRLVVTVGPAGPGHLRHAAAALLGTLRHGYRHVRVFGHRRQQVDGRPALSTYGRARNRAGVRLRFVVLLIAHRPRDYAITTFTAFDTDPRFVLPRVDAIAGSFHIRARHRR